MKQTVLIQHKRLIFSVYLIMNYILDVFQITSNNLIYNRS